MPLLTPPTPQTPAQLARAQIEQALADSAASALAWHDRIGKLLTANETGATPEEIMGDDLPLLVAARQQVESAIAAVRPELAERFKQDAQIVADAQAQVDAGGK